MQFLGFAHKMYVLERLAQFRLNHATFRKFLLQELCTWSAAQTPRLMD